MAVYTVQRSGDLSLPASNSSSAWYGGTAPSASSDSIDLNGYSVWNSQPFTCAFVKNNAGMGATVSPKNHFTCLKMMSQTASSGEASMNYISLTFYESLAGAPIVFTGDTHAVQISVSTGSVIKFHGNVFASSYYGIQCIGGHVVEWVGDIHYRYLSSNYGAGLYISSGQFDALYGTIYLEGKGSGLYLGNNLTYWYGDLAVTNARTSSDYDSIYGAYLSSGSIREWRGNLIVTNISGGGTCYGIYTMSGTIDKWFGKITVNSCNSSGMTYGLYASSPSPLGVMFVDVYTSGSDSANSVYGVYSGSSINFWCGTVVAHRGYGFYHSSGTLYCWIGDVYAYGYSTGCYLSSYVMNFFGDMYNFGKSGSYGLYLSPYSGMQSTFGNIYNYGDSGSYGLYVTLYGSSASWYGNVYNFGGGTGAYKTGSASFYLYTSENCSSVCSGFTPSIDQSMYEYAQGYARSAKAIVWNGGTPPGLVIPTITLPPYPSSLLISPGSVVDASLVVLAAKRWPNDALSGTYFPPVASGYSALAPGYGANGTTTGTLAASKIRDATYGSLADASVLVAAGGTFNEAARNTDPGIANVLKDTSYKIANVTKTGTFDEAARNVDPGVANVRRPADGGPASYKIAGTTLIGTLNIAADNPAADFVLESAGGNYHAPDAAEVIPTAVFGPNSSIAGAFPIPDHLLRLK